MKLINFTKWLDRLLVVIGAISFAQFPQFFQQYIHQLSGHVSELSFHVRQIEQSAALSKRTIPAFISKFTEMTDPDFIRQGELMHETIYRFESFKAAYENLSQATIFTKPFLFLRHVDMAIAKDTFAQFQWGFVFSLEGLFYTVFGMLLGYFFFRLLAFFFSKMKLSFSPK